MKKVPKIAAVLLSALIAATGLAGCHGNTGKVSGSGSKGTPDYLNATGFPIVKTPITLTAMVSQNVSQPDWSQMLCWQAYEKKTNVHIQWQCIPSTSITEKRALALASNQLPDLFYRSSMTGAEMIKYGEQGYFVDLSKSMIDQYAPNLKALMKKYQDIRKGVPTADGKIYAFPGLSDTWPVEANPKIFINTKWLKAVNKQSPTTIDQFYDVLKAFKSKDINGNGKADEIPFTSDTLSSVVRILRGSWGLGTRGFGNENFDIDAKGQFRFIPTSAGYKEELDFLHKLYTEGLLDKQIFTMNQQTLLAQNEKNQDGSFAYINVGTVANASAADFVGLGTVLKGPHGDQLFAAARGHIATTTGMLITKNCKYPEAAARWVDYFYSQEGSELLYAGVEGKTYTKDSTGRCTIMPEYTNVPAGSSFDQVFSKVSPWAGGGLPALSNSKVFQGAEMQPVTTKEADALKTYAPKELWAPFSFTVDENTRKAELESDITSYITQKQAEFIQGKTPLSDFDKYVQQLKTMGLDDYVNLYKTAYARYQKN